MISIKEIQNRLNRHPLMRELELDSIIDYTIEFMRLVGSRNLFTEKEDILELKDYRAELPCECNKVLHVLYKDKPLIGMAQADPTYYSHNTEGYYVRGNVLFSSIKEGEVKVIYNAVELDEEGLPMLADNAKFIRALESYIKKQWFTILLDIGKIDKGAYANAQQEYAFNVGQCQSYELSIDEMEHFKNHWTSILNTRRHSKMFR